MLPPVRPALDPLAHRAAIQALESQRAAYARFARTMDGHRTALAEGSGDAATAAADAATRGQAALSDGARQLAPLVAAVHEGGSAEQQGDVERQLAAMMDDARSAEAAIHNLTAQLEAWREAYARQLADVGLTPGAAGDGGSGDGVGATGAAEGAGAPAGAFAGAHAGGARAEVPGYGPPRRAGDRAQRPSLIDRRG